MTTANDLSGSEDATASESPDARSSSVRALYVRVGIAVLIAVLVIGYTVAVLAGAIATNRHLSATDIALLALGGIAVSLVIWPSALKDVKSLSVGSFRVDIDNIQRGQDEILALLKDIFPLLLPDNVLNHLKNLESGKTNGYGGSGPLKEELRLLRYMHLISVHPTRRGIGDVPEGTKIDLARYVQLTSDGRRWIARARELEKFQPVSRR